jgi:predicted small lipoprotein YifL
MARRVQKTGCARAAGPRFRVVRECHLAHEHLQEVDVRLTLDGESLSPGELHEAVALIERGSLEREGGGLQALTPSFTGDLLRSVEQATSDTSPAEVFAYPHHPDASSSTPDPPAQASGQPVGVFDRDRELSLVIDARSGDVVGVEFLAKPRVMVGVRTTHAKVSSGVFEVAHAPNASAGYVAWRVTALLHRSNRTGEAGRREPRSIMLRPMTMRLLALPLLLALAACGSGGSLSVLHEDVAAPDTLRRTVLFNVSYVGVGVERAQGAEGLQRCLDQPGTAVTVSGEGSPPIRQVSVHGGRDDIRRFEQCLLFVLNTKIERVPQQVETSDADDPERSLQERYDEAPNWPVDPWSKDGVEVSREELVLAAHAEHCDWERAAFMAGTALGAPRDERGSLWVRDPEGVLSHDPRAQAEFRSPAALPADAEWTGYAQGGVELWVAASDNADYVYLVNRRDREDIERWVRGGGLCA